MDNRALLSTTWSDFSYQHPDRRKVTRPEIYGLDREQVPRGERPSGPEETEHTPGGPAGGPRRRDSITERIARILGITDTKRYDPVNDETAQKLVEATRVMRIDNERIKTLLETQMYPEKARR